MSINRYITTTQDGLVFAVDAANQKIFKLLQPIDIEGCNSWFDASDIDTITKDGSDFVSQWDNKACGSTLHFVQGTPADQPQYFSSGFGTKDTPRITFADSGTDWMDITSGTMSQWRSVFVVAKLTGQAASQDGWIVGNGGGGNDGRFGRRSGNFYVGVTATATPLSNGTNYLLEAHVKTTTTDSDLFVNGSSVATGVSVGSTPIIDKLMNANGITLYTYGDVTEIVSYERILTDSEITFVRDYLNDKHGVY